MSILPAKLHYPAHAGGLRALRRRDLGRSLFIRLPVPSLYSAPLLYPLTSLSLIQRLIKERSLLRSIANVIDERYECN